MSSFTVGVWFPTGSRDESPSSRGFSHFIEHMLFKGTKKYSAEALAKLSDDTGGYINAFTERDFVCLHCSVPMEDWELALDLVVEMAFNSTFPPEEFDREKEVIVSEISQAADDVEETAYDAFLSKLWPGQMVAKKIAGETEEVLQIELNSLIEYYMANFGPKNALFTVSSDVGEKEIADRLDQLVSPRPHDRRRENFRQPPAQRLFKGYKTAQTNQAYSFEAAQLNPPFEGDEYYSLEIFNSLIGESPSSRLFQAIREKAGLAYSVFSTFSVSKSEILWIAQVATKPNNLIKCVDLLDEELSKAGKEPFSDLEVAEARRRLAGAFSLAMEDPDFRQRRLARQYFAQDFVNSFAEEKEKYLSVPKESILRVAGLFTEKIPRSRFAYGKINSAAMEARGWEKM